MLQVSQPILIVAHVLGIVTLRTGRKRHTLYVINCSCAHCSLCPTTLELYQIPLHVSWPCEDIDPVMRGEFKNYFGSVTKLKNVSNARCPLSWPVYSTDVLA